MKRLLKIIILLAILAGAYFGLRPHILWLDYFDGTITEKVEKSVPTVMDKKHAQDISEYSFIVATDDGRELKVLVKQLQYFRSRPQMRVKKGPFTSDIQLIE
ncbi:MAG: hypothetical protein JRJ19_06405 [Deltaproteobacteria bacterium]|nr:hypothetical protein [Deltaproteobacteria bacterium]MBW1871676.1 hypothetical protein [Deltaproteobacteria bacterium]